MRLAGPATKASGAAGVALIGTLVILLVVAGSSAPFVWFMNQQQSRAGARYRAAAALAAAEAGVHRMLSVLESAAPRNGSSGRTWRSVAHSESVAVGRLTGRFTVSFADEVDGAVLITSTGEVAGVTKRLRARVYLSSPALLAALYGASFVRLEEPPAVTMILPYGVGTRNVPWVHIAAGQAIWFVSSRVSVNDPAIAFQVGPGPLDAPEAGRVTDLRRPGPVRFLLGRGADLLLGPAYQRIDVQQIRAMGLSTQGTVQIVETLPVPPRIDRGYYRTRAASNTANVGLNEAAGKYLGDAGLARKPDSLYSPLQFGQLQSYLRTGLQPSALQGVIVVTGGAAIGSGQRLHLAEGALIAEGNVVVAQGATLEITHSAATRTLPGVLALNGGALVVADGARLRVHGLVYADGLIEVGRAAHVDIVGSVQSNHYDLSFSNVAATVVIRYDPAVLGTPGLSMPADVPVVAWVAAWEEVP